MPPYLPLEVLQNVCDQVEDCDIWVYREHRQMTRNASLRGAALVCKDWAVAAQSALWRHLMIYDYNAARIARHLLREPSLLATIQHVTFNFGSNEDLPLRELDEYTTSQVYHRLETSVLPRVSDEAKHSFFSKIDRLHPAALATSLLCLATNIRHVHLERGNWNYPDEDQSPAAWRVAIRDLPSLESIRIDMKSIEANNMLYAASNPNLKSLTATALWTGNRGVPSHFAQNHLTALCLDRPQNLPDWLPNFLRMCHMLRSVIISPSHSGDFRHTDCGSILLALLSSANTLTDIHLAAKESKPPPEELSLPDFPKVRRLTIPVRFLWQASLSEENPQMRQLPTNVEHLYVQDVEDTSEEIVRHGGFLDSWARDRGLAGANAPHLTVIHLFGPELWDVFLDGPGHNCHHRQRERGRRINELVETFAEYGVHLLMDHDAPWAYAELKYKKVDHAPTPPWVPE